MKVVSWNIHRCIGLDRRQDPDRVADVIRGFGAQVVGLQEVDSEVTLDGHVDQLEHLARRCEMDWVAGAALQRHYGGYGNGLLTTRRILSVRRHDLGVAGREPRGALHVTVEEDGAGNPGPRGADDADDRRLSVWITHLGLRHRERRRQARRLRQLLQADDAPTVVLMGDFNDWRWRGPAGPEFDALLGGTPAPRTFPARFPLLALDRIWVRPRRRLVELVAPRDGGTRAASDHLPLVARLGGLDAHGAGPGYHTGDDPGASARDARPREERR